MEQIDKILSTKCETLDNNEGPKFKFSKLSLEFRICSGMNFPPEAGQP